MKLNGKAAAITLCAIFNIVVISGCSTLKDAKKTTTRAEQGPMFEAGTGRSDITLAILRPQGVELGPKEEKYLDFIQGALNSDFHKFSDIQLFDSKNIETVMEQQKLSLSGHYSDTQYISIGKFLQSKYILTGTLTRIDNAQFLLELSFTDVESAALIEPFQKIIKLKEIINSSASRSAITQILPRLGVRFTQEGLKELKTELSAEETEAQNALALSYEASRSGNLIDALIYSYTASDADKNSAAAQRQASETFKTMGGSGTAIKESIKRQAYWKNNLIAFEDFYRNHPPFEFVYTVINPEKGITDFDTKTTAFDFYVGLRHKSVSTMQSVLNDILKELKKTDYKKAKWGFDNWPEISAASTKSNQIHLDVFNNYVTFNITAAMLNEYDEVIASLDFQLYGQLILKSGNIIAAFSTQERHLTLTIPNDLLLETDNYYFQIMEINGYDPDTANANAYLRNSAVVKMPAKSRITIPADKQLTPELPEEREKRLAAAQKERDKQQVRDTKHEAQNADYLVKQREQAAKNKEKRQDKEARKIAKNEVWDSKELKGRRNIYLAGMYNPVHGKDWKEALGMEAGLGFGYKNFSIDGRLVYPINHIIDKYQGTGDLVFGLGGILGYSYVWNNFIASLEGGATWYRNNTSKSFAVTPTFEGKLDIVPWKPGIGFRFAYKLEMGWPKSNSGELYKSLFSEYNTYGNDSFRIIGNPSFGLVLWY